MSPNPTGDLADLRPTYGFQIKDGSRLLGELILYIAERCAEDPIFGAVKLNKLLWRADFLAYARDGSAPRCRAQTLGKACARLRASLTASMRLAGIRV